MSPPPFISFNFGGNSHDNLRLTFLVFSLQRAVLGFGQVHGYWTWVESPLHVHHHHQTEQYNCHAGFHNFVTAWTSAKQDWCCAHQGISCTGPNPPAVHLHSGNSWVHVKTDGVWTWRQVPRTEDTPFVVDCSTGLDRAASWAAKRKSYCCTHEGKACNSS